MALKVDGNAAVDPFDPLAGKLDKAELQWPSSPEPASPHHIPIVVDSSASSSSSHSPSPPAIATPANGQSTLKPPDVATIDESGGGKGAKSKPASSVTAAKPASGLSSAKPKSTKPRSPSPAPSAPAQPPRPPLRTVRLDIKLGGPEDYEVDISVLSKETGQRPPTPTAPAKHDTSDESNSEGDDEGDDNKLKKKRRKVCVARSCTRPATVLTANRRRRIALQNTMIQPILSSTTPSLRRMNGRSLHKQSRRASMCRAGRLPS